MRRRLFIMATSAVIAVWPHPIFRPSHTQFRSPSCSTPPTSYFVDIGVGDVHASSSIFMDITVKPYNGGNEWSLEDLLADPWGRSENPPKHFTIHPDGQALETMADLNPGPYASLDAALSEIETHTRGVCRLDVDYRPEYLSSPLEIRVLGLQPSTCPATHVPRA